MVDKFRDFVAIDDDSLYSARHRKETFGPVPCVKSRDEIKKFEEAEECFILDFDPSDDLNLSNLSITDDVDDDFCLVAEKGQVALRDYPHSRYSCAKYPFETTPHESHCELCYCYVCDLPAPCPSWAGMSSHCHAFYNVSWNMSRKFYRDLKEKSIPTSPTISSHQELNGLISLEDQSYQHNFNFNKSFERVESDDLLDDAKIYVGNISHSVAYGDLRKLFSGAGEVKICRLIHGQGFGFVTMRSVEEAGRAIQMFHGFELNGRFLIVRKLAFHKIYIGNLPSDMTCEELHELFELVAAVKKSEVIYGRGYGFVSIRTVDEVEKAVGVFHGFKLKGNFLNVRKCPSVKHPYKIYVGNLPYTADAEYLEDIFNDHGYDALSAWVVNDEKTGKSRGFGFVEVASEYEMIDAIANLDGLVLDGKVLRVDIARHNMYAMQSPRTSIQ